MRNASLEKGHHYSTDTHSEKPHSVVKIDFFFLMYSTNYCAQKVLVICFLFSSGIYEDWDFIKFGKFWDYTPEETICTLFLTENWLFQDHVYSALSESKNMWNVWYNFELGNISADKIFHWNNATFEHSVYLEWTFVCACMDTHRGEAFLSHDAFGALWSFLAMEERKNFQKEVGRTG